MDTALLLLRIVVGLYVAAHGARFLFGWFGGLGIRGTQGFMGSTLGFRPAWLWALGLGIAEFAAHWLIDLGKCEHFYEFNTDQAFHLVCKLVWISILLGI